MDISPTEFYALLRQVEKPPTTSAPGPAPYLEAYRKASQRAKNILCITISTKLSAIFKSANIAANLAKPALPDATIEVLDCNTAAAAQGFVVLAAARAADSGKNLSEVMEIAESVMSRVNLFATLDTLDYLAKCGRVPQASALVNSLLNIKPVFTLNHGGARTLALPRSIASAIKRMLKLMEQNVTKDQPLHVAVMHADALDKAITLEKRISARFNCCEIFITEFTPVMGVHTGPGLIGAAFYGEQ